MPPKLSLSLVPWGVRVLLIEGRPPILARPPKTDVVASFSFMIFEMFFDIFKDHVLLILCLCAGLLGTGRQIWSPLRHDSDHGSFAKKIKISNFVCTGTISKTKKVPDFDRFRPFYRDTPYSTSTAEVRDFSFFCDRVTVRIVARYAHSRFTGGQEARFTGGQRTTMELEEHGL